MASPRFRWVENCSRFFMESPQLRYFFVPALMMFALVVCILVSFIMHVVASLSVAFVQSPSVAVTFMVVTALVCFVVVIKMLSAVINGAVSADTENTHGEHSTTPQQLPQQLSFYRNALCQHCNHS